MTTIKARWVAGFEGILPDGTRLIPGETVVEIGADEAALSDHWEPSGTKAKDEASKAEKRFEKAQPTPTEES